MSSAGSLLRISQGPPQGGSWALNLHVFRKDPLPNSSRLLADLCALQVGPFALLAANGRLDLAQSLTGDCPRIVQAGLRVEGDCDDAHCLRPLENTPHHWAACSSL